MENDITIGMDLGNRKHVVCALDRAGKVLFRSEVANTPEALEAFFRQHAGATVAMETGLCCRWISALSAKCGCDTVVGFRPRRKIPLTLPLIEPNLVGPPQDRGPKDEVP